ncbi:MAG: dTDP-4-dehydrorhamnose reductase [Phycisphaeraceae bacterium]
MTATASHRLDLTSLGPVFLIGVGGMLARAWEELLARQDLEYVAPSLTQFDLTSTQSIHDGIDGRFKLVINCAAWTNVDGAEKEEAVATAVNGTGVGDLARRCKEVGATLVHYSTDYVFAGQATRPYQPYDPRQPLNAYGRSKAVGEELIEQSGCRHLLIRTSWLYAPWGNNFVRTITRLAKERPTLKVVADQRGRPTSAEHLAGTSLRLIEAGAGGIYHVTDGGECTWHEFATAIAAHANPACQVTPCTSAQYPTPAKRPAYSVLDLSSTEALLGPMPHWRENLADVLNRLEKI